MIPSLISVEAFRQQVDTCEASIPYSAGPLSLLNTKALKAHPKISKSSILHRLLGTEAPLPQPVVVEVIRPSQRLSIPARTFRHSRAMEFVETSIV